MNRRDFLLKSGAAVSLSLLAKGPLSAQTPAPATPPASVPIRPPPPVTEFKALRRNVGYFTGRGGSIGWLVNPAATVAVDTQFPETAAIFLRDLPGRNGRTLEAVINTHHHGDHTGGNGVFRPATKTIVAHANVPGLMRAAAARNPKPPAEAELAPMIPDATFPEAWRHDFGDETISARYFGAAHTGGDIAVHFEKANVIHLGDLLFNRLYPVTDKPGGCTIRGWIKVLEAVAAHYPADAIYICGHGNAKFGVTAAKADLALQAEFLKAVIAHVEAQKTAGKPREEIVKLTNLPGWEDWHAEQNSRLPGNLGVAYDELAGA